LERRQLEHRGFPFIPKILFEILFLIVDNWFELSFEASLRLDLQFSRAMKGIMHRERERDNCCKSDLQMVQVIQLIIGNRKQVQPQILWKVGKRIPTPAVDVGSCPISNTEIGTNIRGQSLRASDAPEISPRARELLRVVVASRMTLTTREFK
jgi:hypothetical protein